MAQSHTRHYRRSDALSTDALHELAELERKLRGSTTYAEHVEVGQTAARVSFETAEYNEHFRSNITASVAAAVCEAEHWSLSVVHDPLEKPEQATTQSMLTINTEDGR